MAERKVLMSITSQYKPTMYENKKTEKKYSWIFLKYPRRARTKVA